MAYLILCIVLFGFIGISLIAIFFQDIAWQWQEQSNRNTGITNSERTPEWETSTKIFGWISFIFWLVMLILLFTDG